MDYYSFLEQAQVSLPMLKFTVMSKFELQVSVDLHVFVSWEETGAAKGNVKTWQKPQKGNINIFVLCMIIGH